MPEDAHPARLPAPSEFEAYVARFPADVQAVLREIRDAVREAAPGARETIRYGMPTFAQHGNLVHFAAHRRFIGFYPAPRDVPELEARLAPYRGSKSALHFPLGGPVPLDLVQAVVRLRVERDGERARRPRGRRSGR